MTSLPPGGRMFRLVVGMFLAPAAARIAAAA